MTKAHRHILAGIGRFRAIVLALIALFILSTGPLVAADFVNGTDDLPLAPGLANIPGAGIQFDSTSGRIVDAYARGTVALDEVLGFYRQSLPQLGWQPGSDNGFIRAGEILTIEGIPEDGALLIHFSIRPR